MANGTPGKKIPAKLRARALELLGQKLTVEVVATRVGVSKSVIRNWVREERRLAKEKSGGEG